MTQKRFDPPHMRGMVDGFHAAVEKNGVMFLAGQVAYDENLTVISGGLVEQTRQALKNVKSILDESGQTPATIGQMMIFYKHTDDLVITEALGQLVELKNEILPGSAPVGFACSVHSLLEPEMLVEVQVICTTEV